MKERLKNIKDARDEMIKQAKGKVMNYAVRDKSDEEDGIATSSMED